MIVVDTGPLIALFDPRERAHARTRRLLEQVAEPLVTTAPVLAEALHVLGPTTQGSRALREFVQRGGLQVWPLDDDALGRAFELMERHADCAMDLTDASLVTAAEAHRTTRLFTLEPRRFAPYRVRTGRTSRPFAPLE